MPVKREAKTTRRVKVVKSAKPEPLPSEEAGLAAREQAVAAREGELTELRARVEASPKELDALVSREIAKARAEVEERARVEDALRGKDVEVSERLFKAPGGGWPRG